MQKALALHLGAFKDKLHLFDGFPMPVCHFKRAYFSQVWASEAAYGYCASKGEKYFGFKGNLLMSSAGVITELTVTAAHIDEREASWDVIPGISGMLIKEKSV